MTSRFSSVATTMKEQIPPAFVRFGFRRLLLLILLFYVVLTQHIPSWGEHYALHLYPHIARTLSAISMPVPLAVGDLFIAVSLAWLVFYPLIGRMVQKRRFRELFRVMAEYLVWLYVWFYLAWGLNYSQANFYRRTGIAPVACSVDDFRKFAGRYIDSLNQAYCGPMYIDPDTVADEVASAYRDISPTLGIHPPFQQEPRAKTMLFTPLCSMVGVMGSMGPFFCEFTLNGDLLPSQYPSTYAHELAHLSGISSEAEANFYAYQVCTRSAQPGIRFSGYLALLPHVLINARRLLDEAEYRQLAQRLRPEVVELYQENRAYWQAKYSPLVGKVQNWVYDLYLKGNKIESGRKNYSEVIGLLMSYEATLPDRE